MGMATQHPEEEEEEVKWVNHYSSRHQILLVGEGDFSFSLCLALAFGSASNICATSLDSYDEVITKYKRGKSNMHTLERMGALVLHEVNATQMKSDPDLHMRKFDRIVFNFPHAGFYGKEDNNHMIRMHRDLMRGFFKSASQMLRANGEVHVTHKTTPPFDSWNLKGLALRNSLLLIEPVVEFKIKDYPSYNNKRGSGSRCDQPFPLGECSTFKFALSPAANKISRATSVNRFSNRTSLQLKESPVRFQIQETSFDSRRSSMIAFLGHANYAAPESPWFDSSGHPLAKNIQRKCLGCFNSCFSNVSETFGRAASNVNYPACVSPGFDGFGNPQRNVSINMNDFSGWFGLPLKIDTQKEIVSRFDGCFSNVTETHGRAGNHGNYSVHGSHFSCFRRYMHHALGGTVNGEFPVVNEVQCLSTWRQMVREHGSDGY